MSLCAPRAGIPRSITITIFPVLWKTAAALQPGNIGPELFSYSLPIELKKDFFNEGVLLDSTELWKLEKSGVCDIGRLPTEGAFQFVYDTNIDVPVLEPSDETKTECKGSIAFRGQARGRVRIIYEPDQMDGFADGDILISSSTNPALMPVIIRCAAIVTDEGGIGSHAAIIARELKKPCVIGTKFATHIFKDGDMVEVDADNGIVRKIYDIDRPGRIRIPLVEPRR